MTIKRNALLLLLIFFFKVCAIQATIEKTTEKEDIYTEQWKKVSAMEAKGLPKSALLIVDEIYKRAKSEKNSNQLIKASMYRLKFNSALNEDPQVFNIIDLKKEAASAIFPVKQIMRSLLGEMYWAYYKQNRYRFLGRTQTLEEDSTNLKNWDMHRIVKEVENQFTASLQDSAQSQKTDIKLFDTIVAPGTEPRALRPSLYDFLAHRAVSFFKNNEASLPQSAPGFLLSDPAYFGPAKTFAMLKPPSKYQTDFKLKAISILQQLTLFRLRENDISALLDLELNRLLFIHENSIHEKKDSLYLLALTDLNQTYPDNLLSVKINLAIAQFHFRIGSSYAPLISKKHKWENKTAFDLCQTMVSKYPKDKYSADCKILIADISNKDLVLKTEQIELPGVPLKSLVNYKNVDKIFTRIYKTSEVELNTVALNKNQPDRQVFLQQITNYFKDAKPFSNFSTNLPNDGDYNRHAVEMALPALPEGIFVILTGTDSSLQTDKNAVTINYIKISNISYFNKTNKAGEMEFYVTNRSSGAPLKGISVQQWLETYTSGTTRKVKGAVFITDENGFFKVPPVANIQLAFSLEFSLANDRLSTAGFANDGYYNEGLFYLPNHIEQMPEEISNTFFFTDRAIYRPGQTVFFKGIGVKKFPDGKQELIKNKQVNVTLYDANNQKISELQLSSNDYGSFNSSFQLNSKGLNGQMRISDGTGDIYFSVEDYKRPTFEIKFTEPAAIYKLNDSLFVNASAKAFSGADIAGANFTYRVVRNAQFPIWWLYTGKGIYPSSPAMEITQGVGTTGANGAFGFVFKAIPDFKVSKDQRPEYTFTVYVSVTDINGETQSNEKSFVIGYTSFRFSTDLPETLEKKEIKTIKVNATNLAGQAISTPATMTIYKLKDPERIFRQRNWERPDTFLYTKEIFYAYFPEDIYAEEDNFLNWLKEKKVFSKSFDIKGSKNIEIPDIAGWASGKYVMEIKSTDNTGELVNEIKYFTLTDKNASQLPYVSTDWFSFIKPLAEPKEKALFLLGSSNDLKVLYEIEKENKVISRQWLSLKNEQKLFEIPILEEYAGNLGIHLTFVNNNRLYMHNEVVVVPFSNKNLDVQFETFRNKLEPGQKETWKIKISSKNREKTNAEMMATLFDASLNVFRENKFNFDVNAVSFSSPGWESAGGFLVSVSELLQKNWNIYPSNFLRNYDQLKTFGYTFYFQNRYMLRKDAVQAMAAAAPETEMAMKEISQSIEGIKTQEAVQDKSETTTIEKNIPFKARTNFNETAFFYPVLKTDDKGVITISFTIPEALTRWKMLGLAHTQELKYGFVENELVTQKELMSSLNTPRFFRTGDHVKLFTKLDNLGEKVKTGTTEIHFTNALTNKNIDSLLGLKSTSQTFTLAAGGNAVKSWDITVPLGLHAIAYQIKSIAGNFSDGEENSIPVLSDEILVTESFPLTIRGKQTKNYSWDKFYNNTSATLKNHSFSLEFSSNPAWYAVQAIPYMMEQPNECTEQLFNRYYANNLASHLVNTNPKIAAIFNMWKKKPQGLLSPLEKNETLKNILLDESPWVMDAKDETERMKRIALLFDLNHMSEALNETFTKLLQSQTSTGAWPWFKGMREDRFISQYIVCGLGRLGHLGIKNIRQNQETFQLIKKGLMYLDKAMQKDFTDLKEGEKKGKLNDNHLSPLIVQYLYARSFFKDIPLAKGTENAYAFFKGQAQKYWVAEDIYLKGMLALALFREKDVSTPKQIIKSLREFALHDEEAGMYFKSEAAYYWYRAPIERQALLIEAFDEVAQDTAAVEDLKLWLLKQKQTQNWNTSKATAEACYALLLKGKMQLNDGTLPDIQIAGKAISFSAEEGTGNLKKIWTGQEITKELGRVSITSHTSGAAWGSLYWQYFEKMDKVTSQETLLALNKKIFLQVNSKDGPELKVIDSTSSLQKGDLLKIRLEISVTRDMEYVHLKDLRASGLEPENVLSQFRYQDGPGYYESTRDAATHFFIDYLPKGKYTLEYGLRVSHEGNFSNGLATLQCMYAPEFTTHTKGSRLNVQTK